MRTDKELIQLVLDNFDNHFRTGLCSLFRFLICYGLGVNTEEFFRLHQLIELHRPDSTRGKLFWWESGQREPRIEFLNTILKTLS